MLENHQQKNMTWSNAEIQKLIDASNVHKNKTIDWIGVASHFPNRTPQQCKSFYNNRIRTIEVKTDRNIYDYYLFMISIQMQKPKTYQQNLKKLICDCRIADMYILIANLIVENRNFMYNQKFMGIMLQIIEIHSLLNENLTVAFSYQKFIEYGEYILSKEMFEIMSMRMSSFDVAMVKQKIQLKL
ncbi:Myb-like_DNA-binding domain-containing protein [Hexamita inflata]|uniref:Myb-like DNA-binding domain-containing protein n=1 Tax=Hexamita inflata TaxID=28002 RepID=A0AA86PF97_9EUKA|nr:Myb-like DNA-binding domain-containing protein [Hexamita inflata]